MTTATSTYLEEKIINHVLRNTSYSPPSSVYIALFTTNPGDAYTGTEVTSGSYQRVQLTSGFGSPSSGSTSNLGDIIFNTATAAWGTVTHVAIMNAATTGSILFYGPLSTARVIGTGDAFKISASQLHISFGDSYSYFLANELLDHILNNNSYSSPGTSVYIALYTTLPNRNDTGGTEVTSGEYDRIQTAGTGAWNSASSGSTANTSAIVFAETTSTSWGTIQGLCLRDSDTAGNQLFRGVLAAPISVLAGDGFQFPPSSLQIMLNEGSVEA